MTENPNQWSTPAAALAGAHRAQTRLNDYPEPAPASEEDAYALQDELQHQLAETVAGWKIGCTSELAREIMGASSPIYGPVLASRIHRSGAHIDTGANALRAVETEIALELGAPFKPRAQAYGIGDIRSGIAAVYPAFEIVNKRLPGDLSKDLHWIIADFSANQALVLGPRTPYSPAIALDQLELSVSVNSQAPIRGEAARAYGGPDVALTWFVNAVTARGHTLAGGTIVTTGLISELIHANPGDHVTASAQDLGSVDVVID